MRRTLTLTAVFAAVACAQAPVVLLDGWHNNEDQPHYRWDGTYPGGFSELGKLLERLGIPVNTLRMRALRLRERLQGCMEECMSK